MFYLNFYFSSRLTCWLFTRFYLSYRLDFMSYNRKVREFYFMFFRLVFDLDNKPPIFLLYINSIESSFINNFLNLPELMSLEKLMSLFYSLNSLLFMLFSYEFSEIGRILMISWPHLRQFIVIRDFIFLSKLFDLENLYFWGDKKSMCLIIT